MLYWENNLNCMNHFSFILFLGWYRKVQHLDNSACSMYIRINDFFEYREVEWQHLCYTFKILETTKKTPLASSILILFNGSFGRHMSMEEKLKYFLIKRLGIGIWGCCNIYGQPLNFQSNFAKVCFMKAF